jgi:tetratricopeptide (TPR) repeat protein
VIEQGHRPGNQGRRIDPARSNQLLVVGDRLFRGKNLKKAEERYLQAARLDPGSAAPRIRLAQIAIVREQYAEAANRFREAETAEPGWVVKAPDIQAIYGEPSDFAHHLARLESHLQIHPGDRDAWLVLGAQFYLSGRTARAADVFLRLSDSRRRSDIALAAFLDATNQD